MICMPPGPDKRGHHGTRATTAHGVGAWGRDSAYETLETLAAKHSKQKAESSQPFTNADKQHATLHLRKQGLGSLLEGGGGGGGGGRGGRFIQS
jgi:hypothetical protein